MRGVLVSLSAVLLCVGCQGIDTPPIYAEQSIGAAGGDIESLDGTFKISIPPGALLQEETFRLEKTGSAPSGAIGQAYQVRPNLALALAATFTFDYSQTDVGRDRDLTLLNIGANLKIDRRNAWTPLAISSNDTVARIVTATSLNIGYDYGLIQDDSLGEVDPGTGTETSSSTSSGTTDTGEDSIGSTSEGDDASSSEGQPADSSGGDTSGGAPDTSSEGETTSGVEPGCDNGVVDSGEVCLSQVLNFAAPNAATAVSAIDVDGDGNLDVVVAGSETLYVLHGNGSGTLSNRDTYDIGAVALAPGDFDDDGDLDVAVLQGGDDGALGIMLNDAGTLDDSPELAALNGLGPIAVAAALLDGNADLDLAVLNGSSSDVSLFLGDGAGLLEAGEHSPVDLGAVPQAFALGDFNNDDLLDLVTASVDGLEVRAGNGQARFGNAVETTTLDEPATAIAVGRFNADDNLDVAVATSEGSVFIYPGDGLGGFGAGVVYTVGEGPVAIVAVDLSGDDTLDLVTANAADGTISVLIGRSRGGVEDTLTFEAGSDPSGLAVGDFNDDDALDVVVSNAGGEVTLLLSAP